MDGTARSLGVIETDAYCERCGFNLHAQQVWRDERLDLPLCRCPECGRHQAAGHATTASTAWLHRLGVLGLLVWLTIGIAFAVASLGLCVALQAGASEVFVPRGYETRDGARVYETYEYTSPSSPGPKWVRARDGPAMDDEPATHDADAGHDVTGHPWAGENVHFVPAEQVVFRVRPSPIFAPAPGVGFRAYVVSPLVWTLALIVAGAAASVALAAAIAASAFWYWPPRRRAAACLAVPTIAALIIAATEWHEFAFSRADARIGVPSLGGSLIVADVAAVAALQLACVAFGLRFGRPLGRLLLMIFVPPRARQAFAFLWHCDDRTMPPASRPRSHS